MLSRSRFLLALLLAVSARAQTKNIVPTPITGNAIGLNSTVLPTALTPSLILSPVAPTVLLTPLLATPQTPVVAAPTTEQPKVAAANSVPDPVVPATPLQGWASRLNFKPGQEFFDGGTPHSDEGAVFEAVPKNDGAVRVHIVKRAPAAAIRPVPGTQGLSGQALFDKVAAIQTKGQIVHAYEKSSAELFSRADNVVVNGKHGVIDAYSGIFVIGESPYGPAYIENGDANGDGFSDKQGMNVEHVEPQSLFDRASPMRSDLHIQMATFQHPNSVRGNLPFGIVVRNIDYENKAGAKRGLDANGVYVFEPPKEVKGRVARALLYYNTRYAGTRTNLAATFWNRQIKVMLDWNREYPPDVFEARRNNNEEIYQGNRNAFVDDPGLADRIGADALWAGPPPTPRQLRRHAYLR